MRIDRLKVEVILAERGMTKSALAELSGLSRQSIGTILGRGTCAPKSAGMLAKSLSVPVAELMEVNNDGR